MAPEALDPVAGVADAAVGEGTLRAEHMMCTVALEGRVAATGIRVADRPLPFMSVSRLWDHCIRFVAISGHARSKLEIGYLYILLFLNIKIITWLSGT